jgi:hypothetical protein
VFAECEGLEAKRNFRFPTIGSNRINLVKEKPAQIHSNAPKKLDNSSKTYEALKKAKDKDIQFEQVTITIGSGSKVIHLSLGELKVNADFIEKELAHLQSLISPEAPVVMGFKKAYMQSGHDLEQFVKEMGIEITSGEVIQ